MNYVILFSDMPDKPINKIITLIHFRLIYKTPEDVSVTTFTESKPVTLPWIKQVKIFEFVREAQIWGEGIIDVPLVTNTWWVRAYRQESKEG